MPDPDKMNDVEQNLISRLYRFDCPGPYDLGDYRFGLLSEERRKEIEAHVSTCPHCREELRYLDEFIVSDIDKRKIEPIETEKPRSIIPFARNEVRYIYPEAVAAIRSVGAAERNRRISITYESGKIVDLYYSIRKEQTSYNVSGQFVVHESLEKNLAGALVEVWKNNTISVTVEIDSLCSFRYTVDELGSVLMRVSNQEGTLLSFNLDLKK